MVGSALARKLVLENHDVVVIDKNQEKCDKVFAESGVIAITGSITSVDTLKEAGIEHADVVVAATENDASNLVFAVLSRSFNVPLIIGRINHPEYEDSYKAAGVNTLMNENEILVDQMMVKIYYPEITRIASIGGKQGNVYKLTIPQNAQITGRSVQDIVRRNDFPTDCLFLAKSDDKNHKFSILHGEDVLNPGDEVFFITKVKAIGAIRKILMEVETDNP